MSEFQIENQSYIFFYFFITLHFYKWINFYNNRLMCTARPPIKNIICMWLWDYYFRIWICWNSSKVFSHDPNWNIIPILWRIYPNFWKISESVLRPTSSLVTSNFEKVIVHFFQSILIQFLYEKHYILFSIHLCFSSSFLINVSLSFTKILPNFINNFISSYACLDLLYFLYF